MKLNEQDDGLGGKAEQWQPEEKKNTEGFFTPPVFLPKSDSGESVVQGNPTKNRSMANIPSRRGYRPEAGKYTRERHI